MGTAGKRTRDASARQADAKATQRNTRTSERLPLVLPTKPYSYSVVKHVLPIIRCPKFIPILLIYQIIIEEKYLYTTV